MFPRTIDVVRLNGSRPYSGSSIKPVKETIGYLIFFALRSNDSDGVGISVNPPKKNRQHQLDRMTNEEKRAFYEECASILGIEYDSCPIVERPNRWNNRHPGNGRFMGYGLIRLYSINLIQLVFTKPIPVNITFDDPKKILDYLKTIKAEN